MIPMQQEFMNKVKFCVGSQNDFKNIERVPCVAPFSERIMDFLQDLSSRLMEDKRAKRYSDIVTFAFWCRKSSVLHMKKNYHDLDRRKGRGLSFHIAPSNIPMMFAFSLVSSMLAGNSNVVRISSKGFPQTEILCTHLNDLFSTKYKDLKVMHFIITYPHDDKVTDYISQICDSRIIWGGNRSVAQIRKSPLKASAIELPFYDRFSFAVIDVKEYLKFEKKQEVAERFYVDTYFSDQNACSSPQLVCWLGGNSEEFSAAREEFWSKLRNVVEKKYSFQAIQGVDKLSAVSRYSIVYGDGAAAAEDMALVTVFIDKLHGDLKNFRCPGGYFYEYHADKLDEICTVCTNECQTIAYFGIERDDILQITSMCKGVDRVVPIGNTMNFTLVWDGFDFIDSLSKIVG